MVPDQSIPRKEVIIEERYLSPSNDSEVLLGEVKATIYEGNKVKISGSTDLYVDQPLVAYHLTVDVEKNMYTTTKYTEAETREWELRQADKEIRNSALRRTISRNEPQEPTSRAAGDLTTTPSPFYRFNFELLSEDIINIDLAKTTGSVYWRDNYTAPIKTVAVLFTPFALWAVTEPWPVILDTHWFIDSASSYMSSPLNVATLSNYLWLRAKYYNDDFWFNDYRTHVEHYVSLTNYSILADGKVGNANWDFDEDGENSALVYHSHVFSLSGATCYYAPCYPGTGFD